MNGFWEYAIDSEHASLSRMHYDDDQIEPILGSPGCFPTVYTTEFRSLAYTAVSRFLPSPSPSVVGIELGEIEPCSQIDGREPTVMPN